MRSAIIILSACFLTDARADTVVAARTLPAHTRVELSHLAISGADTPGAFTDPYAAEGLETRVTIYAGRPIRHSDLTAPALVERNQIIELVYLRGTLRIATEGRALGRGAEGDRLRVMNLSSRNTLFGIVAPDGSVHVDF